MNDVTDKLMESFKDSDDTRKERKKNAVAKEAEKTEEDEFKKGKRKVVEFVVGVKESLGSQQASGRRRRSTGMSKNAFRSKQHRTNCVIS